MNLQSTYQGRSTLSFCGFYSANKTLIAPATAKLTINQTGQTLDDPNAISARLFKATTQFVQRLGITSDAFVFTKQFNFRANFTKCVAWITVKYGLFSYLV